MDVLTTTASRRGRRIDEVVVAPGLAELMLAESTAIS